MEVNGDGIVYLAECVDRIQILSKNFQVLQEFEGYDHSLVDDFQRCGTVQILLIPSKHPDPSHWKLVDATAFKVAEGLHFFSAFIRMIDKLEMKMDNPQRI